MGKDTEHDIYRKLRNLTSQPGYVFTLARLKIAESYRYNILDSNDKVNLQNYSHEKICNNEMLLLEGFLRQNIINFAYIPTEAEVTHQIGETKSLLADLQRILNSPTLAHMGRAFKEETNPTFHELDGVFKELFFYGAESGWPFQFEDLANLKYQSDNEWLKEHKNFTIEEACQLAQIVNFSFSFNLKEIFDGASRTDSAEETLKSFVFNISDLAEESGLSYDTVAAILNAFSVTALEETNQKFSSIADHNEVIAYPWLNLGNDKFLLLNANTFSRSIYQAPYFWILREDKKYYDNVYTKHRGQVIEDISARLLSRVFGKENVHQNILLYKGKDCVGEIDVLVEWGGVVILVQNKAQMLTQASRKGGLDQVKDNLQKAIGGAYKQSVICAKALLQQSEDLSIKTQDGEVYSLKHKVKEIFPACIVGEDYTGLTFQARSLLEIENIPNFKKPLLASVIYLDTLTRILGNPIHFIHYLDRLDDTWGKIISEDDYAILGYHVHGNLYPPTEGRDCGLILIGGDASSDVDRLLINQEQFGLLFQMIKSAQVPDFLQGVNEFWLDKLSFSQELPPFLKYWATGSLGKILSSLSKADDFKALSIGRFFLSFSEEYLNEVSKVIQTKGPTSSPVKKILLLNADEGGILLILHVRGEMEDRAVAFQELKTSILCAEKEFTPPNCLGLLVSSSGEVFGYDFIQNAKNRMKKVPQRMKLVRSERKVGRNEKCPCGSDKKFKRCCGSPTNV